MAEMFYRGDVKPHRTWAEELIELQHLTRQHEFMTSLHVQAKLNARALLEQVCPTYEKVFYNLFSTTSLHVLRSMLRGNTVTEEIVRKTAGSSLGAAWTRTKLEQIQALSSHSKTSNAQRTALLCMVEIVLTQQETA